MSPQRPQLHASTLFHATRKAAPRSIVEFAVHPSQENELRTQLLDCGADERTLIGIQVDLHFLRLHRSCRSGRLSSKRSSIKIMCTPIRNELCTKTCKHEQ